MNNPLLADLTFPMLEYGSTETPWDLRPLLYRGGAAAKIKLVANRIAQGELSCPLPEWTELVQRLHGDLAGDLAGGGAAFRPKTRFKPYINSSHGPIKRGTTSGSKQRPTYLSSGPITCYTTTGSNTASVSARYTMSLGV